MPDLLEPPPTATSAGETDAADLAHQFDTALKAKTGVEPADEADPAKAPEPSLEKPQPSKPAKPDAKEEEKSIVPEEFLSGEKEQKPADDKPEAAEEIPANAGAKQLREVLARREAKIQVLLEKASALEKQVAERGEGPSKDQEDAYKAAVERAAELEQKLERAAYKDSPRYQKFDKEVSAEITSAKLYLEGTDVSPGVLDAAAHAVGAERVKLLRGSGLDSETIALVGTHLARADSIRRERDASLEMWKASATQDQEAQRAEQAVADACRATQEAAVLKRVGERMRATLQAFQRVEGETAWNETVDERERKVAEAFEGKKTLEELAEIGYRAEAERITASMNVELRKRLAAVTEERDKLKAAQPGTGHSADAKASPDKPASETDIYRAQFEKALAEQRAG